MNSTMADEQARWRAHCLDMLDLMLDGEVPTAFEQISLWKVFSQSGTVLAKSLPGHPSKCRRCFWFRISGLGSSSGRRCLQRS